MSASTLSFLSSEYPQAKPDSAFAHIIPVPLEFSVSYGSGTKAGPEAILRASEQLEAWELGKMPGQAGFYTAKSIDCSQDIEKTLAKITTAVEYACENSSLPLLLGGEHTVTLGALRALKKYHANFGIVHFDAHADLRPEYQGQIYSHACVMYRAIKELNLPLVQFGIREYSREEADLQKEFNITCYTAEELYRKGLPKEPLADNFPEKIYISFDVDCFDASLMPATGTPAPGGLFWHQARELLLNCAKNRTIIGCDVVELAPLAGLNHPNFTAAKLSHLLLALAF